MGKLLDTLKRNGISAIQFAYKMKVTRSTAYYYDTQAENNTLATLIKISEATGIQLSELIRELANPTETADAGISFRCPHCRKSIFVAKEPTPINSTSDQFHVL
jgi:transcriptional regulator with XRE-family HTH domain